MNRIPEGENLRTVELFAGIGGFRVAADEVGLETVWANDIDDKACGVYRRRFGAQGLVCGDIWNHVAEVPDHDLLTAGFPCQPFSAAGKKLGLRDPRGHLFQVIVDVLRRIRPAFFVLENVKRLLNMERGAHFATILAALAELDYWVEWRLVNVMHLGLPQNRRRVIVVGWRGESKQLPIARLVVDAELSTLEEHDLQILQTRTRWTNIEEHGRQFPTWGLASHGRFFGASPTFFAQERAAGTVRDILEDDPGSEVDFTDSTRDRIGRSQPVNRFIEGVQILYNQGGGARMGYTVFGVDGVAPTLTSATSRHYERYGIGNRFRRLTHVEYARLQGFADDHCDGATPYDQYALYGNAVPPVMARWAIERLISPQGADLSQRTPPQLALFGPA